MKKPSALIVDDEETDRYLLRRHLKKTKVFGNIYEADGGRSAMEMFESYKKNQQERPDDFPPLVLFLDVNMPELGGFGFLAEFADYRRTNDDASIIVMMFTSSERDEDKEKAFSHPFVKDFISKGEVSTAVLLEKLLPYL